MSKKSKSFISMVLALAMVGSVFTFVSSAKDNPYLSTVGEANFSVSSSFCKENGTTKVFVDISEGSQMSIGLFKLKYNTAFLKATNIELGVVLKSGFTSKNITASGDVKVSYADVKPNYAGGRIFEVEFQVIGSIPENVAYLDVPVKLEVLELKNHEDYLISSTVSNGKITLINTSYGDVNQSGSITAADALMVLYANTQLIDLTETQSVLADVNGDGKVAAADALLILQYSAGVISNYPLFMVAKPANVRVESKDETFINFVWDESRNVIGYNVFVDGVQVNDTLITETSYLLDDLQQDTKYTFQVQAVNVLMGSDLSDALPVSTDKADRTVIFKDYDGSILSTQVVLSGEDATPPTLPGRVGYTFTGWDGEYTGITSDITLTAQYEINQYQVIVDYQYAGNAYELTVPYNTKISKPENSIQIQDYTLEGWYLDKNCTNKWNFEENVVTDNIHLYAKWVTWSAWTTDTSLKDNPSYQVQSKTQYSYSDKSTTTSSNSTMSGWTLYDTQITGWKAWSSWSRTAVTATSTRQVEDRTQPATYRTEYNYSRWYNGTTVGPVRGTWNNIYCSNYAERGWGGQLTYIKTEYSPQVGGYFSHYGYEDGTWFNETTRQVEATAAYKEYRYRDANLTYYFYQWSPYSEWSDTEYTASETRQVKTQTLYRYLLKQQ